MEAGCDVGGWCPEGRKAEDGIIPLKYPLTELPGAGYKERTRQNVLDSDATVIIYSGALSGGTKKTFNYCEQHGKPFLLIDQERFELPEAIEYLVAFLRNKTIKVLNVAGPRESGEPAAYAYTKCLIVNALKNSTVYL